MEKISVIVPVYQAEQYLPRCIDSILSQTYTNLEVILVDDGSKDQSGRICDEYAGKDSRVLVIHQPNAGVAAARNHGLDIASGDFCTFVDSDDYIDATMYQTMLQTANQYDCDVVMCDCLKESREFRSLYTHNIRSGFYNYDQLKSEYYPHLLIMENVEYPATISNWLLLFRRNLSSGKDLPRYLEGVRYSEDLLFGAQLMYAARSFYYLKGEAYYHYCMNPASATHTYVPDKWKDYMQLHHAMMTSFCGENTFDFARQIDLCLLFFLYNTCGDVYGAPNLTTGEKIQKIRTLLREPVVRHMFRRIKIMRLPISNKQRAITWCYKYQIGIGRLTAYYGK